MFNTFHLFFMNPAMCRKMASTRVISSVVASLARIVSVVIAVSIARCDKRFPAAAAAASHDDEQSRK